nr:PREDICTED: FXYD domain-containing ion transport regulator 3 [Equus przewalskii]XP_008513326.1 PREDICTED: FXYD domain-containing ion transport regulator 3 [Equus przewalskii]XP_008513327.1 PREDICTED: FXYD domain-containing ion transport regulator 3 [Equus przewalskii]
MQDLVALSLLILLAGLPALEANDPEDKNSPFYYGENRHPSPHLLPPLYFVPRVPQGWVRI